MGQHVHCVAFMEGAARKRRPTGDNKVGCRLFKKSELIAEGAEKLTLGKWIAEQRGSPRGGKARLSECHEQVWVNQ